MENDAVESLKVMAQEIICEETEKSLVASVANRLREIAMFEKDIKFAQEAIARLNEEVSDLEKNRNESKYYWSMYTAPRVTPSYDIPRVTAPRF